MQMTLHSLVSYDSFDWTCRGNKAALLKNLVVEGSIEKCNQDVKQTSSNFVARVSLENINRNALAVLGQLILCSIMKQL